MARCGDTRLVPAPAVNVLPDAVAPVRTQATYRLLTMRGLAPAEAANLTAFLVGLDVHRAPWSIAQVNRLLFLRELYNGNRWGERERHY